MSGCLNLIRLSINIACIISWIWIFYGYGVVIGLNLVVIGPYLVPDYQIMGCFPLLVFLTACWGMVLGMLHSGALVSWYYDYRFGSCIFCQWTLQSNLAVITSVGWLLDLLWKLWLDKMGGTLAGKQWGDVLVTSFCCSQGVDSIVIIAVVVVIIIVLVVAAIAVSDVVVVVFIVVTLYVLAKDPSTLS